MRQKFSSWRLIFYQSRFESVKKGPHRQVESPKQPYREENLIQIFHAWSEAIDAKLKTHKNGPLAHNQATNNQEQRTATHGRSQFVIPVLTGYLKTDGGGN